MNDYSFDYLNYLTNVPGNMNFNSQKFNSTFANPFTKDNSTKMNMVLPSMMEQVQLVDPREGLIRGNLFKNLYDPYKNFRPNSLNPNNEQEALMYQIMQYKFALVDLKLYLDTHPNDEKISSLYKKYLEIEKQMCTNYENMYGPLTTDSMIVANGSWNWINKPWPWEVK